jgi:hypothetical protein
VRRRRGVIPEAIKDPALVHEEPNWIPAIVTTVVLDLIGLAALFFAYGAFHVVELAQNGAAFWPVLVRWLYFAPLTQLGAIPIARRNRFPWTIAVWAFYFAGVAVVAAVMSYLMVASIPSVVR